MGIFSFFKNRANARDLIDIEKKLEEIVRSGIIEDGKSIGEILDKEFKKDSKNLEKIEDNREKWGKQAESISRSIIYNKRAIKKEKAHLKKLTGSKLRFIHYLAKKAALNIGALLGTEKGQEYMFTKQRLAELEERLAIRKERRSGLFEQLNDGTLEKAKEDLEMVKGAIKDLYTKRKDDIGCVLYYKDNMDVLKKVYTPKTMKELKKAIDRIKKGEEPSETLTKEELLAEMENIVQNRGDYIGKSKIDMDKLVEDKTKENPKTKFDVHMPIEFSKNGVDRLVVERIIKKMEKEKAIQGYHFTAEEFIGALGYSLQNDVLLEDSLKRVRLLPTKEAKEKIISEYGAYAISMIKSELYPGKNIKQDKKVISWTLKNFMKDYFAAEEEVNENGKEIDANSKFQSSR